MSGPPSMPEGLSSGSLRPPGPTPLVPRMPGVPKSKDGLIRMLLQSATPNPQTSNPVSSSLPPSPITAPPSKPGGPVSLASPSPIRIMPPSASSIIRPHIEANDEDGGGHNSTYIQHISGSERDVELVLLDHPYAKPWNWRPELASFSKPTKTLFVPRVSRTPELPTQPVGSEFVDVISEEKVKPRPLDIERATHSMKECMRHANFGNPDVKDLSEAEDWEDNLSKEGWTLPLHRLFNKTVKILHADRLSRLALQGSVNEPIQIRLVVDKTAKRMRQILASVLWDVKMVQWLHNILCDSLPREYLAAYVDALQTLKARIPTLVDKMMAGRVCSDPRYTKVTRDGLRILLKRKWDPAAPSLTDQKMKKLPGNAILIMTPSGPSDPWISSSARLKHWNNMFGQLGRFVIVSMPSLDKDDKTDIGYFLQRAVKAVVQRIREVKRGREDRAVILIGWGVGAAINCQAAALENVTSLVCLGFPMYTLDGVRGEPDDPVYDLKSPILFVIGENSTQGRPDEIEDMRERMRTVTGMVVVGGADEALRLSKRKKRMEGITQGMVDRCIMDDIREFLLAVLTTPPAQFAIPVLSRSMSDVTPNAKRGSQSRRRKASTNKDGTPAVKKPRKSQSRANSTAGPPTTPQSGPSFPNTPAMSPAPSSANSSPMPFLGMTPPGALATTPLVDCVTKARKMLDMSQKKQVFVDTSSNLMNTSPLLSSALTSPGKTATNPITPRLISSSQIPAQLPKVPISLPTTPTAPLPRHAVTTHAPMPASVASIIQQATASSSLPQIVMPSTAQLKQVPVTAGGQAFTPSSQTVVRMIRQPSDMVKKVARIQGPAGTGQASMVVLTSQGQALGQKSSPVTIAKPVSTPIGGQAIAVKRTGANPGGKDNLYIVALPSDQVKGNVVQYGSASSPSTAVASSSKAVTIKGNSDDNNAQPTTSERRNVAEILASLSGLMPDPPKTGVGSQAPTTSTPVALTVVSSATKTMVSGPKILSSPGGTGSRIVRVLQTAPRSGSGPSVIRTATVASVTPGNRSRKQTFVTSASSDKSGGDKEGETVDSDKGAEKTVVREDVSEGATAHPIEKDELEEDMSDLEYVPYQKKKSPAKAQQGKVKTRAAKK